MVEPIRFSTFRAGAHVNINPCFAAWTFLFEKRPAFEAVEKVSNFFTAFWAFEQSDASLGYL